MSDLLLWVKVILLFGGCVICMGGLLWHKTAHILRFFEVDVNPEKGFKGAMVGFVMLLAGVGLLYLRI